MDVRSVLVGSVGQGGSNKVTDVRVVQRLLNDWLAKAGQTQLKVDGLVGPKTIGAITSFQKANSATTDGRVDVGGKTINALFNQHLSRLLSAIDLSSVKNYIGTPTLNEASFSDAALAPLLKSYIAELRKSA
jgi:peptidoglycan hydrolase-like protein with peptidoglycan-binding domain